ncbi:zf-TFIIB domain-containing protein [Novosphingobium sp. G106]|nr:zf-TFIIB domain-containing protein [Novosphingobium sp. G106]MBV1692675.1 zf-TFIIB domain-containing protein [Novosphingobium sp. G106]
MTDNIQKQGLLCPTCRTDLIMSERQGMEIDYCPQCRGVWLDRGELDKIIERSAIDETARQTSSGRRGMFDDQRGRADHDTRQGYERGHHGRRKSFLSDLFD